MYEVYVIYSSIFERYYVGITNNLDVRIKQHNSGKAKSTKAYIPWKVVLTEDYETRSAARKREIYIKSAAGRRWRKLNIWPRGATE